jgi:chromate transport protein ChrA
MPSSPAKDGSTKSGVVLPGVFVVLALAMGYSAFAEHSEHIRRGLHGLTAGAVGIMASLVVNAAKPLLESPVALLFALAAFIGVVAFELNMLLVLVVLVPLASWLGPKEGTS